MPSHAYEAPLDPQPAGYMTLRTTTSDALGDYDNPNKMTNAHGYDVPRGSMVGYETPKNQQKDTHVKGKVCNDVDWVILKCVHRVHYENTLTHKMIMLVCEETHRPTVRCILNSIS